MTKENMGRQFFIKRNSVFANFWSYLILFLLFFGIGKKLPQIVEYWPYWGFIMGLLFILDASKKDQSVYEVEIFEDKIKVRYCREGLGFFWRKKKGVVGDIDFSSQFFYREWVTKGRFSSTLNQMLSFDNGKGEKIEIEVSEEPELKEVYEAIEKVMLERLFEKGKEILRDSNEILSFGESKLSRDLIYVGHYGYQWDQITVKFIEEGLLVKDLNPVIEPKMLLFESISNRHLYVELLKWKIAQEI